MSSIVTLSLNPAVDVASETEFVEPTHKIRTTDETYEPGGGGINVARVIVELGGDVEAICLAGGATGRLLDELLAQVPVRRRLIPIAGNTRISLTVIERRTGREFRFVPDGPELRPSELAACLAAIRDSDFDYFVASGSIPRGAPDDILAEVGAIVSEKGARLVLDSSGIGLRATLGRVPIFLFKPSLGELEHLAGGALDEQGAREAAVELARSGKAEIVAVTLGPDGVLVATSDRVIRLKAPKIEVRSAVGAGDSFVAGLTLALAEGRPLEDAAVYAVAAGTATVLAPGSMVCRREDVEALHQRMKREMAV